MKRLILLLLLGIAFFITTPAEMEASEATNDTGPELVVSIDQADFEAIDHPPGERIDRICQLEVFKDPPGKLTQFTKENSVVNKANLIFTKKNLANQHYYKLAGTDRLCNSDLRIDNYTKPKVIHPSDIRIRNDGQLNIT